jgi:Fasciclin domain
MDELAVASGWETSNWFVSVEGADSNKFTLFAPLDEAFVDLLFMADSRARLVTLEWARHLELFLENLLSPAPLIADFMSRQPETVATSVGNETITITKSDTLSIGASALNETITITKSDTLSIGASALLLDLNPSCVNG